MSYSCRYCSQHTALSARVALVLLPPSNLQILPPLSAKPMMVFFGPHCLLDRHPPCPLLNYFPSLPRTLGPVHPLEAPRLLGSRRPPRSSPLVLQGAIFLVPEPPPPWDASPSPSRFQRRIAPPPLFLARNPPNLCLGLCSLSLAPMSLAPVLLLLQTAGRLGRDSPFICFPRLCPLP